MLYLLAGTVENKNVLFLSKENTFMGSENLEEARKLLPDLNRYHKAGTTWSTTAALWWMTFKPKLIIFEGLQEVETALLDRRVKRHSNISGSITATDLKEDFIIKIQEECRLIDEGFDTAKPFYEQ